MHRKDTSRLNSLLESTRNNVVSITHQSHAHFKSNECRDQSSRATTPSAFHTDDLLFAVARRLHFWREDGCRFYYRGLVATAGFRRDKRPWFCFDSWSWHYHLRRDTRHARSEQSGNLNGCPSSAHAGHNGVQLTFTGYWLGGGEGVTEGWS